MFVATFNNFKSFKKLINIGIKNLTESIVCDDYVPKKLSIAQRLKDPNIYYQEMQSEYEKFKERNKKLTQKSIEIYCLNTLILHKTHNINTLEGAKLFLNDLDCENYNSFFTKACSFGHIDIIKFFIKEPKYNKFLELETDISNLQFGIESNAVTVVKELLTHNGQKFLLQDSKISSKLLKLCDTNNSIEISCLLLDNNINYQEFILNKNKEDQNKTLQTPVYQIVNKHIHYKYLNSLLSNKTETKKLKI